MTRLLLRLNLEPDRAASGFGLTLGMLGALAFGEWAGWLV